MTSAKASSASLLARELVIASIPGPTADAETRRFLADGCASGVCLYGRNITGPEQTLSLTDALREVGGPDFLVSADLEGGYVWRLRPEATHWPSAMALGAANRPDLTRLVAHAAAREFRAMGIDTPFAPVADVSDHPRNPVIGTRAFGGTAKHVAQHVTATIGGYREGGVVSCVKHFPGHGNTDTDSHFSLPILSHSIERLNTVDLVPFIAGIRAGADMVMVSHLLVRCLDPDTPASLSARIINALLRVQCKFQGVIVTDALDMKAVTDTYGLAEASVLAVMAGCDLVAFNGSLDDGRAVHAALAGAIASGRLPAEQIEASIGRTRALRRSILRNRRPLLDVAGSEAHQALALQVAQLAVTSFDPSPVQTDGGAIVVEFDPRLPFADPNVRPPYRRFATDYASRLPLQETIVIHPHDWAAQAESLMPRIRAAGTVIIATRNAWRDPQQALALTTICKASGRAVHVAMRDPQDTSLTDGMAHRYATYSDDPSSITAIVDVLTTGSVTTGRCPVSLS